MVNEQIMGNVFQAVNTKLRIFFSKDTPQFGVVLLHAAFCRIWQKKTMEKCAKISRPQEAQ